MRLHPFDILELAVRDGIPAPRPGPDGAPRPPVPLGRRVDLGGRGTTFVREVAGPPGAPTLLLLHGWMASGGLNWFRAFDALSTEFRVLAPDLRGHARGIRSAHAFRLTDCADDLAALLDELDAGPVLVAGYSMGGLVAQLFARRHPERVAGLVLCATPSRAPLAPLGGLGARPTAAALGALGVLATGARLGGRITHLPSAPIRSLRGRRPSRPQDFVQWTIAEFRRHDVRHLLEAASAVNHLDTRASLCEIGVPTAAVVTTRDRMVAPAEQLAAAALVDGVSIHEVDGGHAVCATSQFVEPFRDACHIVASRVR